jgi:hypothetical protein
VRWVRPIVAVIYIFAAAWMFMPAVSSLTKPITRIGVWSVFYIKVGE